MTSDDGLLLEGRYRLIEQLGRGGSAVVWRAHDERLNRNVAVKFFDASAPVSATAAVSASATVETEAQALALLSHPHIASVFDAGSVDGRPYLVVELVEGESLAAVFAHTGLSWRAAAVCAAQVASALAAAHERGIVHRDVTPANVMLTPSGVKLIDFGISSVAGEPEKDEDGGLRGTPLYVAPERLETDAVAPAADIYSLGIVLYRALAGELPWAASNVKELWAVRRLVPPRPLPDHIPGEIADVCLRCLALDVDDRPDATEVSRILLATAPTEGLAELTRAGSGTDADALGATRLMAPVRSGEQPGRSGGKRVPIGLVAAAVLVTGALGASAATWRPADSGVVPESITRPRPPAAQPGCEATFRLTYDDGHRFHAAIVAAGNVVALPAGWQMSLRLPAEAIDVDRAGGWQREADTVTSSPQPAVAAGAESALMMTGTHQGALPLPARINVDGRACDVLLSTTIPATGPAPARGPGDHRSADDQGDESANDQGEDAGGGQNSLVQRAPALAPAPARVPPGKGKKSR